ncbi:hypothetical protein ACFYWY_37065 [Streptomyces sp. NPDC002870]|uniref:hypothetical protein n=1 Tax=Streptomyces sp. NPDC002870 TaxID=3364666 RepID=UPI0036AC51E9
MPQLIHSADVRPRVSYRTILVGPITFERDPEQDNLVRVPGDGLSLMSSDNDFYPLVRMEVWDGPVAIPEAAWDYEREFHGQLDAHLGVFDLDGCEYGQLSLQEGRYHIRLLCKGRDHVEAALVLEEFPPGEPHEDPLEAWLLQLWPSE